MRIDFPETWGYERFSFLILLEVKKLFEICIFIIYPHALRL